jgi:hypothetical protein
MNQLLPGLSREDYRLLWLQCLELHSLKDKQTRLSATLSNCARNFRLFSIHLEFRSPWAIQSPQKGKRVEVTFAQARPSADSVYPISNNPASSLVADLYARRQQLVLHFAADARVTADRWKLSLNGCDTTICTFVATFVVPAFFGHFLGGNNLSAFIEAVGAAFDCFAFDPDPFLSRFDGSFLCCVLRQFFFAPIVRGHVGEQFTVFFDSLACMKHFESASYSRIQRFFSMFLTELAAPIPACGFLRALFGRISRDFADKSKVIMTVVVYAIVANLMLFPTTYAVLPLTSNFAEETASSVQAIKFYCATVCHLPIPDGFAAMATVPASDGIDDCQIEGLVQALLRPADVDDPDPGFGSVTMPLAGLQFLSKFEGSVAAQRCVETIVSPIVDCAITGLRPCSGPRDEFALVLELLTQTHPDACGELPPRVAAVRERLVRRALDVRSLSRRAADRCRNKTELIIALAARLEATEQATLNLRRAFAAAESQFANRIAHSLTHDAAVSSELDKKKNVLKADANAFASFIITHVEAFSQKNPWAAPFIGMVARRFHAIVMTNFPLAVVSEDPKQRGVDQLFLARKSGLLANLQRTGVDSSVERIIRDPKATFATAQDAVLRACLFENPIESARQIVLSLFVVEDLFVCEFGAPPEANQLMPLLANLFILSPMPTPLSFGKWLRHFFQPLLQARPEWFDEEAMRPLEHYFQFNSWMAGMLLSISGSDSADRLDLAEGPPD